MELEDLVAKVWLQTPLTHTKARAAVLCAIECKAVVLKTPDDLVKAVVKHYNSQHEEQISC
jgi:hypothetical protein